MFTKEILANEEWSFSTSNPSEFTQAYNSYEGFTGWTYSPVDSFNIGYDDDSPVLEHHDKNKFGYEKLPLAAIAMKTVIERGGISGPALSRLSQKSFCEVMNTCYAVGKGDATIYTVGDKIYATLSDSYVPLNISDVMDAACDGISFAYSKNEFLSGNISHSYAVAEYDLSKHTEIAELYARKISEIKKNMGDTSPSDNWQLKPMVRVMTSNTGLSGANIYPYFLRKSGSGYVAFPFAKPITLEHKGNSSLTRFRENVSMLGSSFREGVEQFANLQKITIDCPLNCFKNVAKRVGLPKKLVYQAAIDFEAYVGCDETSAGNLYIGLTEILNYAYKEGKNAEYIFTLQDLLSRVLTLKFRDYNLIETAFLSAFKNLTVLSRILIMYDLPYCEWDRDSKSSIAAAA